MRYNELNERKPVGRGKKTLAKFISNIQKQLLIGLKAMQKYNNISPRRAPIGLMPIIITTKELALLLNKVEHFMVTESVDANVTKAFNDLTEYTKLVKRQVDTLRNNIQNIENEKISKIMHLVLASLDKLAKSLEKFTNKTEEYLTKPKATKKKKKTGILSFLN